ncbi:MAG: HNH endonuclease, partial [Opitutales bacterium]|nr:HNH endonuclease [Opitutales bacterium]
IMLKLELLYHGHTTPLSIPTTISIEHILPQNPTEDTNWLKDFTENDREIWTDRIGNLALISRRKNSTLGNLSYKDKKEKYFKKDIELFSHLISIYKKYDTWNLDSLKLNNKEAIDRILGAYGIEQ